MYLLVMACDPSLREIDRERDFKFHHACELWTLKSVNDNFPYFFVILVEKLAKRELGVNGISKFRTEVINNCDSMNC